MFVNSDFSDLLQILSNNHVRYMVIGGYAVIQYAEPRFTKDLDLWTSTDSANAASIFRALKIFGAPLAGLTEKDFAEEGYFFQIGVAPIRVDILMGIPGENFEDCWKRHIEVDFEGLKVNFISKEDLIASKRASGRP
jgi:predicted nucleotidyltransferase